MFMFIHTGAIYSIFKFVLVHASKSNMLVFIKRDDRINIRVQLEEATFAYIFLIFIQFSTIENYNKKIWC